MSLNVKEAIFAIECFRIEQLTAGRGMDEPVLEYCRACTSFTWRKSKNICYDAISTLLVLCFASTVIFQWSTMILRKVYTVFCLTSLWLFPTTYASLGDRLPDFRQCVSVNNNANYMRTWKAKGHRHALTRTVSMKARASVSGP